MTKSLTVAMKQRRVAIQNGSPFIACEQSALRHLPYEVHRKDREREGDPAPTHRSTFTAATVKPAKNLNN
jgi:hypothetical protein